MGRQQRDKGLRFERKIARRLRDEGFAVRRIDESSGFSVGSDLGVYYVFRPFSADHPEVRFRLPVAVQCKCTVNPADLEDGLDQAVAGQPDSRAWICIHSCARKLSILWYSAGGVPVLLTWSELIAALWTFCPIKPKGPPIFLGSP